MKTSLILFLFVSMFAFAEVKNDPNLPKLKGNAVKNFEARISNLTKAKLCVSSAKTREAVQDCQKQLATAQRSLSKEAADKRAKRDKESKEQKSKPAK